MCHSVCFRSTVPMTGQLIALGRLKIKWYMSSDNVKIRYARTVLRFLQTCSKILSIWRLKCLGTLLNWSTVMQRKLMLIGHIWRTKEELLEKTGMLGMVDWPRGKSARWSDYKMDCPTMNTFNSQKCRNRNRQTKEYIHYTMVLPTRVTQLILHDYYKARNLWRFGLFQRSSSEEAGTQLLFVRSCQTSTWTGWSGEDSLWSQWPTNCNDK